MLRHSVVFILTSLLFFSCFETRVEMNKPISKSKVVWYKQIDVDLGRQLEIKSDNSGLAISRGRGKDIRGQAYLLDRNGWKSIFDFDYSDYPIIKQIDDKKVFILIHETHFGNYRPKLFMYNLLSGKLSDVSLPKVMWDDKDFLMWKSVAFFENGKGWMVGQLGKLLYFDGNSWIQKTSPLDSLNIQNVLSKDLNDIWLNNDGTGWAVGNSGIILRLENGKWRSYNSPVKENLNKIKCINNYAIAVGQNGTILTLQNSAWKKLKTSITENLNSVKLISENDIWICGASSTLIHYDGKNWTREKEVEVFKDDFNDIDFTSDSTGNYHFFIIGDDGIYSNSNNINFSFVNVTSEVALQRNGISALFFDADNDAFPEVLIRSEKGPNIYYSNDNGINFIETKLNIDNKYSQSISNYAADFNNDSFTDLILITQKNIFKFLLGKGNNQYYDYSEKCGLNFSNFNYSQISHSIKSADFDNDGNLDLYVANHLGNDKIFRGDGSGRFLEIDSIDGIKNYSNHENQGIILSDFNNDNLIDIFRIYRLPVDKQLGELYLNKGRFNFEKKYQSAFVDETNPEVYSCLSNDFNNDGFSDLVIFVNNNALKIFLNNGNGIFSDYSSKAGFKQKIFHPEPSNGIISSADVNNDGYIDLFVSSKLYINSSKIVFSEARNTDGIDFLGNPTFSDYDNDGDMDIFIGSSRSALGSGDRSALFKNSLNSNSFVKLKISGSQANSDAIGAKVFLLAYKNEKLVYRYLHQIGLCSNPVIGNDNSFVHLGINEEFNYKIRVVFPSGIVRDINDIRGGELIYLFEDNILLRNYHGLKKSIIRFFNVKNIPFEIGKVFLFLIILYQIRKRVFSHTKNHNYLDKIIFIAFIIAYIIFSFNTIYLNENVSIFISIAIIGIYFITVYGTAIAIEKAESKFISHYKLFEILGVGGMGKVFKAFDINSKMVVALKVINPEIMKDEENQKRLSAEGEILSSFQHPNIVEVYEIGKGKEHAFVAMQYLPNGSLEEYIQKNFPISVKQALTFLQQICTGLEAIHSKNIIHRDLKSGNIMFDENMNIRIMDFGLSKSPLITAMTSLGTVLGTLGFVAPEQVTNVNIDQRADIFSLGVIMYQMFTKRLPFSGENEIALIHSIFNTQPTPPHEINPGIPIALSKIIMKCLEKNPENRYNSVTEIKEELNKIIWT